MSNYEGLRAILKALNLPRNAKLVPGPRGEPFTCPTTAQTFLRYTLDDDPGAEYELMFKVERMAPFRRRP